MSEVESPGLDVTRLLNEPTRRRRGWAASLARLGQCLVSCAKARTVAKPIRLGQGQNSPKRFRGGAGPIVAEPRSGSHCRTTLPAPRPAPWDKPVPGTERRAAHCRLGSPSTRLRSCPRMHAARDPWPGAAVCKGTVIPEEISRLIAGAEPASTTTRSGIRTSSRS
jgi:hypothetical protein